MSDDSPLSLVEMRFHVPHSNIPTLDEAVEPESAGPDPVKELHDKILAKADVIQAIGDAIVTFAEIHCLTPRLECIKNILMFFCFFVCIYICVCILTIGGDTPSRFTPAFFSYTERHMTTRFLTLLY